MWPFSILKKPYEAPDPFKPTGNFARVTEGRDCRLVEVWTIGNLWVATKYRDKPAVGSSLLFLNPDGTVTGDWTDKMRWELVI